MALIKCPECGKEISDKASACPNCGCPASEFKEKEANAAEEVSASAEAHKNQGDKDKNFRCVRCGSKIPEGSDACPYCGYRYGSQSKQYNTPENKKKLNIKRLSTPKIVLIIVVSLICLEVIAQIMGEASLVLFGILLFACMICFPISIIYLIVCICLKKNKMPAYSMIIGSAALFVVFMFMAFQFVPDTDGNSDRNEIQMETEEEKENDEEVPSIEIREEEVETVVDIETEEETAKESESYKAQTDEESTQTPAYINVFALDLVENWSNYIGEYVRTTFEVGFCGDDYIQSTYEYNYIDVYPDNFKELEDGEYVTVTGYVTGETSSEFEIMDAHIEAYGAEAQAEYNEELSAYNEQKAIEAAEHEADFKEEAEEVSYDDLNRYPDTYKDRRIKVTVKITDVEPDGIIFSGHYEAVINGTSNKVAVYDEREVKEPKLLDGDVAVIYGYGDGLTTVKVQDTSGLIPKTVDEYTIPGINIEYVEVQ